MAAAEEDEIAVWLKKKIIVSLGCDSMLLQPLISAARSHCNEVVDHLTVM